MEMLRVQHILVESIGAHNHALLDNLLEEYPAMVCTGHLPNKPFLHCVPGLPLDCVATLASIPLPIAYAHSPPIRLPFSCATSPLVQSTLQEAWQASKLQSGSRIGATPLL